jgi:hypothetical protein
MKLRKDTLQGIGEYLKSMSAQTLKRGRKYFLHGHVLALECVEPDHLYSAQVRGGEDYDVGLEYNGEFWMAECTCPMVEDCKHAVAAMLELERLALAGQAPEPAASPRPKPAGARVARPVPQPPDSPLCRRLAEHLGRPLTEPEAGFIRVVQTLYHQVRHRKLTEYDFATLLRGAPSYIYNPVPLDLWPDFPPDDYYFWLHLAWEFRRRQSPVPPFMAGITDLNLIQETMAAHERALELEHWNQWFHEFGGRAPAAPAAPLELRLVVHPEQALLEWRTGPGLPFATLKQSQAARLSEQFSRGELPLAPASLPLWSAVYKPWNHESWWSFKYDHATARPTLNRVLRLPLAPDCLVTPEGQPLTRAAEPLRLQLKPPAEAGAPYELTLVTAAGEPPPRILCTLAGQPTLYLSARELFSGPPADAFSDGAPAADWRKLIPAPALETVRGLNFLQATGIPLPETLAGRVRLVPVVVTVSCALKPIYPGSPTEDIAIRITAKVPGQPTESFTLNGWESTSNYEPAVGKPGLPERGVIKTPDRAAQRHFPQVLELLGVKWEVYPSEWRLRLTKKNPEMFAAWLRSLPPEIEVRLDPELASLRDEPVSGTVSLDVEESSMDWFDLKVVLKVGDTTLTPEELKLLLNARGGFVRLGAKGWRRLQFNLTPEEDEQLARLGLHAGDFSGEPQRFHALQLADPAAKKFLPAEHHEKIQRRAEELKTRVTPALPAAIRAELRPYQMEGFHFLAYLTTNHFGGVLADDMGLGKTLQTLAWLAWLTPEPTEAKTAAPPPPSLVVCPKSVTDNWRAEAERFYPALRVRVWRGEPAEALTAARENTDLIVLNYAQLRSLSPAISRIKWRTVILDEAQCIKNPDSQTAVAARALVAEHRLALTGTPIENRLLDLWSIMAFAMPGALGNRAHFLRRFNTQDDPLARRRLAARVRPFLLRRTKKQVAGDLPDRTEEDLLCEMEGRQLTLYRAELKRARQILLGLKSKQQLNDQRFNILTSLLRLRQICCHPVLADENQRDAEAAKVTALEELLEPLMEEGHKVLVFSQFVTMLDLLRDMLKQHEWPHFYLAGETENRGDLVREFQAAPGGAVFLISLKAGGFGLNLTAASYVVLFDPWWNPAVENQAIDRTHRIGQTSKVMAYRLVMRDSIEQKIRALQTQKAALAHDVLGEERFAQSLTLDDLRFLFSE